MKKSCITLALTISLLTVYAAQAEEKRSFTFDFTSCDYGLAALDYQDRNVYETNVLNEQVECHVIYLDNASLSNSPKFNGDGVISVNIDRIQGSGFYHKENTGIYYNCNGNDKKASAWNYKLTLDARKGYKITKLRFESNRTVAISIYGNPDLRVDGSNINILEVHPNTGTVYFADPSHIETLYEIGRTAPCLKKLIIEYEKIDPDAPDSFEDPESQIEWNIPGLSDNTITEYFNFRYDAANGVAPHCIFLPLITLDAEGKTVDPDLSNVYFEIKDALTGLDVAEETVKLQKMESGVALSISRPGQFRIAIKNAGDGSADYKLPRPLNVNVMPADIEFAELNPEALSFTHIFTSYDDLTKTHPAGEYSKKLSDAYFFKNEAHGDALEISMVPDGWEPANVWDGIVPDDTPTYLTREEFEKQYNIDNHHRIYIAPTAELTSSSLSFKASHAGKYKLTAKVKDEFKAYFAGNSQNRTYDMNITPELNNNSVRIMAYVQTEDGDWVETTLAMPDPDKEDSWGMVKNEGWNRNARLHTIYAGDIYYRIEEKKSSEDSSTPYIDARAVQRYAALADALTEIHESNQDEIHPKDGFSKYESGTLLDLSKASQLALYTVSNGLVSNEKLITFDGADVTAVKDIESEAATDGEEYNNEWYTVNGLRITKPQTPGIYIRKLGGEIRKVMIRN